MYKYPSDIINIWPAMDKIKEYYQPLYLSTQATNANKSPLLMCVKGSCVNAGVICRNAESCTTGGLRMVPTDGELQSRHDQLQYRPEYFVPYVNHRNSFVNFTSHPAPHCSNYGVMDKAQQCYFYHDGELAGCESSVLVNPYITLSQNLVPSHKDTYISGGGANACIVSFRSGVSTPTAIENIHGPYITESSHELAGEPVSSIMGKYIHIEPTVEENVYNVIYLGDKYIRSGTLDIKSHRLYLQSPHLDSVDNLIYSFKESDSGLKGYSYDDAETSAGNIGFFVIRKEPMQEDAFIYDKVENITVSR